MMQSNYVIAKHTTHLKQMPIFMFNLEYKFQIRILIDMYSKLNSRTRILFLYKLQDIYKNWLKAFIFITNKRNPKNIFFFTLCII